MKTAETIAQHQEAHESGSKQPRKQSKAAHLVNFQWKKGQTGNPGGRPKRDFAAEFARAVLEANGDKRLLNEYANGFVGQLRKGNAYTFKELAERGYGKLKETYERVEPDVPTAELEERVAQLERELYPAVFPTVAREADEAGRVKEPQSGDQKTNGKAKDPELLPG